MIDDFRDEVGVHLLRSASANRSADGARNDEGEGQKQHGKEVCQCRAWTIDYCRTVNEKAPESNFHQLYILTQKPDLCTNKVL